MDTPDLFEVLEREFTLGPRSTGRARPSRFAGFLAAIAEVFSNAAVGVGALFLLGATGPSLGTPAGPAGAGIGLALAAAGLAAIVLPARLRRPGRRLAAVAAYPRARSAPAVGTRHPSARRVA